MSDVYKLYTLKRTNIIFSDSFNLDNNYCKYTVPFCKINKKVENGKTEMESSFTRSWIKIAAWCSFWYHILYKWYTFFTYD